MKGHSEATIDTGWKIGSTELEKKPWEEKTPQENKEILYIGLENRDAYRLNLSVHYPMKVTMIIDGVIIKKGLIKDLSASGLSCDFFEPVYLSNGQQVHLRFKLSMEECVTIKTEASYLGIKGQGFQNSKIGRFEFSEMLSNQDQDSIHQYILIKQLERYRANRRLLELD